MARDGYHAEVLRVCCPTCGEPVTQLTGWHFDEDERVPRCDGCNDEIDLPEGW